MMDMGFRFLRFSDHFLSDLGEGAGTGGGHGFLINDTRKGQFHRSTAAEEILMYFFRSGEGNHHHGHGGLFGDQEDSVPEFAQFSGFTSGTFRIDPHEEALIQAFHRTGDGGHGLHRVVAVDTQIPCLPDKGPGDWK